MPFSKQTHTHTVINISISKHLHAPLSRKKVSKLNDTNVRFITIDCFCRYLLDIRSELKNVSAEVHSYRGPIVSKLIWFPMCSFSDSKSM